MNGVVTVVARVRNLCPSRSCRRLPGQEDETIFLLCIPRNHEDRSRERESSCGAFPFLLALF